MVKREGRRMNVKMTYVRSQSRLPGGNINGLLAVRQVKGREGINVAGHEVKDADQNGLKRRTGKCKMKYKGIE